MNADDLMVEREQRITALTLSMPMTRALEIEAAFRTQDPAVEITSEELAAAQTLLRYRAA